MSDAAPSFSEWLGAWRDKVLLADLPSRLRWAYGFFSAALLVTLASHTFVNNVKTSIFMSLVGTDQEPIAKSLVMAVLFPVTICYSIAVSYLQSARHLVTGVCTVFAVVFALIALGLMLHRGSAVFEAWLLYYAVETSGVILMPMIWSVVADVTPPAVAPKAFPIIFFAIQLGGILGSLISIQVSSLGGEVGLLIMQVVAFVLIAGFASYGCALAADPDGETTPLLSDSSRDSRLADSEGGGAAEPAAEPAAAAAKEPQGWLPLLVQRMGEGMEGLWLLLSKPYVFGIFFVSYANLVPRTMLDYENSVLAVSAFAERERQISFFGSVNMMINVGTAVLTLFGTRPFVEFVGVGRALLIAPVGMAAAVFALCAKYGLGMSTFALVFACILGYGINSPCKEMLYVRTSSNIKYKAKSWAEWYGNQMMKLLGAQLNLWVNRDSEACSPHCFRAPATAYIVAGWTVLWLLAALAVGRRHRELEADDKVVT